MCKYYFNYTNLVMFCLLICFFTQKWYWTDKNIKNNREEMFDEIKIYYTNILLML